VSVKRAAIVVASVAACAVASHATERHVALNGNDANPGTPAAPLRTIQRAAELAQPGDVVTVHAGVYRERVSPPRGGASDAQRIVYQAAPGDKVEIRGSEVITGWTRVEGDVWKATLPNAFFGRFNPYSDVISGDWFDPKGRRHHTGAVYLDGTWLTEAATLDEVMKPAGRAPLWFGTVDQEHTTLWAQFAGVNPNGKQVEINVRRTVFYPERPGINYITVRGFALRHAATPWAPPTAEQVGLIGTHWSRGWIIENNVVSHSRCTGITLGKYGDQWDNTSANSAEGYVKTIERALQNGWDKATIGHHVVRNNTVSHCEQAGIVGSLGAIFSTITGNTIHDIHSQRLFGGAEMGGIKIHAAIDVTISRNRIYRAYRGLWMDWMAQGTRITGNLCYGNDSDDLFMEANHGPFLVDNNLLLSGVSLRDWSEGGAYVHNLVTGKISSRPELKRSTPYHRAHSTTLAGLSETKGGNNRFYNNVLVGGGESEEGASGLDSRSDTTTGFGLWVYDSREVPLKTGGNIYYRGARPYSKEADSLALPGLDPKVRIVEDGDLVFVEMSLGPELSKAHTALVTTDLLGQSPPAQLPFENPDGSPLRVAADYAGAHRDATRPTAGPFESPSPGSVRLRVW
jgi:alpha-N-arabinofuranosidase